jgi:hypothetical protein
MIHGGEYAYKKKKCKCVECKAAYAAWMREYRKRRLARGDVIRRGKWVTAGD